MFKNVIVRKPGKSLVKGSSSSDLGKPNYELAMKQHKNYIDILKKCGVNVTLLECDERYPDSTFVEDTAVLTKKCAIITNPGAYERKGEEIEIEGALKKFYLDIEHIKAPGTLEGVDVMMVGNHFYIGLSERTNAEGANQLIFILGKYGYTGSVVPLTKVLNLKTGLAYLENNNLLVTGEFAGSPIFEEFNKIVIDEEDSYCANCIWVNGHVIVPEGYPKTIKAVESLGYIVEVADTSEFRKIDGGLSCLSLRF